MRTVASARVQLGAAFGGTFTTSQPPPEWVLRAFGLQGNQAAPYITERTALQLPPVYAAVTLIADMVAKCTPSVKQRTGDEVQDEPSHPVALLLRDPNDMGIGRTGLMKTSQTHYNIAGQCFQQIERDASGRAIRLWPLPETTQPLVPIDTQRGIVGYRTSIGGQSVDLNPDDVIHVRGLSLDGWNAESPIRLCVRALQSGSQMEKYGLDFFLNESRSGGFLQHPGRLTEDAKKNIRKSIKSQGRETEGALPSGVAELGNRHHDIKVLEEGMKWVPTTIAPEEAQFLGSREFINSEVARIWRIPLVLLQSIQGSSVWGTGIDALMNEFVNQTILPIIEWWQDEMTRKLFTYEEREAGYFIQFDVSGLRRGDPEARARTFDIRIKNDSLTINEARRLDGLNPLPGGDESYTEKQARLKPAPVAPTDTPRGSADE